MQHIELWAAFGEISTWIEKVVLVAFKVVLAATCTERCPVCVCVYVCVCESCGCLCVCVCWLRPAPSTALWCVDLSPATFCKTLKALQHLHHTTPHCNTLLHNQHAATSTERYPGVCEHVNANTLQHTAIHCNTCNTLHHTATHRNTLRPAPNPALGCVNTFHMLN